MSKPEESVKKRLEGFSRAKINGAKRAPISVEEIKRREAVLIAAKATLKMEFAGLDQQIDRIVDTVRSWYLIPEAQRRPVVVCLWGMTGVGKTSLIYRIVELLDFEEFFQSMDVGQFDTNQQSFYLLYQIAHLSSRPSILLFDELHVGRTIDDQGHEIGRPAITDLWSILDDGYVNRDLNEHRRFLASFRRDYERLLQDPASGTEMVSIEALEQVIRLLEINLPPQLAKKLCDENPPEFLDWCIQEFELIIKKNYPYDFSKALIFVAGNLNEVFVDAQNVNSDELTADDLAKKTSQIGVEEVKSALLLRFRPEQVARLGGIYVIFPTVSRAAFEKIIALHLTRLSDSAQKDFNVKLAFDSSVVRLIFKEGAVAAQGTRLVLSTLAEMIDSRMPVWLVGAISSACGEICLYFDEEGKNLILRNAGDQNIIWQEKITLRDDRLMRENASAELLQVLGVHEAAHVVVGIVNYECLPIKVFAGASAAHRGGARTEFPAAPFITKNFSFAALSVGLAGYVAEKLVFGSEFMSLGSSSDLEAVTHQAAAMVSVMGVGGHIGVSLKDSNPYHLTSFNKKDDEIKEAWLQAAAKKAEEVLTKNWNLYLAVIDLLAKKEKLTAVDFVPLVRKHLQLPASEIDALIGRKAPVPLRLVEIKKTLKTAA